MHRLLLLTFLILGACATPGGPYPSLQPRAAEQIDPRMPVEGPVNDRPANAGLVARLRTLISQARAGESGFAPAIGQAERLASAAGAPRSDSWVVAQEALSAAVAARRATPAALSDIDAIAAEALQRQGGIAPNDLAAIQSAAGEVAGLDQRQADRIDAVQRRLGL